MNYQIGLSIMVLAFSACMKVTKKGETENSTTENQIEETRLKLNSDQSLAQNDIQIIYHGEPEPNRYTVILKWPESNNSILRVFHTGDEDGLDSVENSLLIKSKIGGKTEKIRIEQLDSITEKRKAAFTIEIKPPEDMVFSGQTILSEDLIKTTERLFIFAAARIYTQQFNLKIKAIKVISEEGALITNFPKESAAPLEQTGLSGGMIEIFSTEAVGRLKIELNGQNGGNGRLGTPDAISYNGMVLPANTLVSNSVNIHSCPGNRGGLAGKTGSLVFSADVSNNFILLAETELSKAGLPGEMTYKCFETHIYPEYKKLCRPLNFQKCESNFDISMNKIGESGQICTKLSRSENFKCEKK